MYEILYLCFSKILYLLFLLLYILLIIHYLKYLCCMLLCRLELLPENKILCLLRLFLKQNLLGLHQIELFLRSFLEHLYLKERKIHNQINQIQNHILQNQRCLLYLIKKNLMFRQLKKYLRGFVENKHLQKLN